MNWLLLLLLVTMSYVDTAYALGRCNQAKEGQVEAARVVGTRYGVQVGDCARPEEH